jgi:hypothetical protein
MRTQGLSPFARCMLALALAWLVQTDAILASDAGLCKKNCNFKPDPTHVSVDANTGKVSGGTKFPSGQAVQVVLEGKNPFKYRYRAEITAAPLEEAITGRFIEQFIPGLSVPLSTDSARTPASGAPGAAACGAEDSARWNAVDSAATSAQAARAALATVFNERATIYTDYQKFVQDTDTDQLTAPAALCDRASALAGSLSKLIDLGDVPAKAKAFTDSAQTLKTAIEAFRNVPPAQPCLDSHKQELAELDALVAQGSTIRDTVKSLGEAKQSLQDFQTLLQNVMEEEYPFTEPFYPPSTGGATGITVVVFRLNLRQSAAKEQKIATIFIQVGESEVSISVGLAFGSASFRRIGRVTANVPGADGKDTAGSRFDYLENGGSRGIAVAMLNARLPRVAPASWRGITIPDVLSTGVGFNLDTSGEAGPRSDWLPVAAGWRFGSDHVLLAVGLQLTRSDCLPDTNEPTSPCAKRQGFKIGDVVPASVSDPLPVQRIWSKGLFIGVTFKTQ